MKALFLGHFAATVAPRILAKVKTPLETSILDDEGAMRPNLPHCWRMRRS